ncbi:transposase [Streptomyces sp. NPDC060085]|uniref:transposase n=1 Tax=Streptomyces sp. NPDC060085 TaxID=3347054 RepID=UPI003655FA57
MPADPVRAGSASHLGSTGLRPSGPERRPRAGPAVPSTWRGSPKARHVEDERRVSIRPLLSKGEDRTRCLERKRRSDRLAFQGIPFVPRTGIGWLPLQRPSFGSNMTCWCPLPEWDETGVRPRLRNPPPELRRAYVLDLSRAAVDASPGTLQEPLDRT